MKDNDDALLWSLVIGVYTLVFLVVAVVFVMIRGQ